MLALLVFDRKTKMEGKRVRNAVLVCLLLGLLMGHCTAGLFFKLCYGACFTICMVKKPHNPLTCGFNCLKKCAAPAQTLDFQTNPHHFCKLGCATSLCTHISTKDNPSNEISPSLVRVSFLWYIGLTFLFFFFFQMQNWWENVWILARGLAVPIIVTLQRKTKSSPELKFAAHCCSCTQILLVIKLSSGLATLVH